jgi:glycerophosphoryl diester phosphodiesterase
VLELDVRRTASSALACFHDPLCDDEVAALAPPGLEAVLARYGPSTRYLVDLKDPCPSWELRVVEAIEAHGVARRVMVQSFDLAALERLHAAAPWLPLSALYRRADSAALEVADVPGWARAVGVHHPRVDAGFVAAAHERGLAVHPWTVDDVAEASRVVGLGVDGVITNVPDVVGPVVRDLPLASAA